MDVVVVAAVAKTDKEATVEEAMIKASTSWLPIRKFSMRIFTVRAATK